MAQRTKLFSGYGKTAAQRYFWKKNTGIECFKFVIYLTIPIFAAVMYTHPDYIKKYIIQNNFVNYPRAADYESLYNKSTVAAPGITKATVDSMGDVPAADDGKK